MRSIPRERGLSIISVLISLAIFGLLISVIAAFQVSIFSYNKLSEARSEIDQKTLLVLREFTREVRTAQSSHGGGYPILTALDNELTFYSDGRGDGLVERIRYFVESGTLKKGVIEPTGQPLTYNTQNEAITERLHDVQGAGPFFYYYDENYNNVTTTAPLNQPVPLQDVRVVELNVTVDPKVRLVKPIEVTTQVMMRNMKTN